MKLKRLLALMCIVAFAASLLNGCAVSKEETPTEPTESGYVQTAQ